MTTDFSSSSRVAQVQPDTGPLSWVIGEIREALAQSVSALRQVVPASTAAGSVLPQSDPATALHHAKTYLHQAHGALQMVDIDGVTIITETVEDLLDRAQAPGAIELSAEHVQGIQHAYQALIEYLEELLAGGVHQPVRLFPYYKTVLEIRGAERIHPADLFFPDLTIRPQFAAAADPGQAVDYRPLRKRFEMALLPFLKSADSAVELANAAIMRSVIAEIEQLQHNQQARAFWWVMQGFADGVAHAQIPNELYVKQLFARINLQLRRLSQGSSSISERLLRDALFFIAGIASPSAHNAQIRSIYRLDGVVPTDFRTRHYGQVDLDALRTAKEHLVQATNMWDRLAAGDASPAAEFEQAMLVLSEAGSKLNAPSLSRLLRELSGIARHSAHSSPGDAIGLEIATSLLFIENTLTQINRLPETFSERADALTARLLSVASGETPTGPARWLDQIYREAQQRQTVKILAGEMLSSLRQVEKMLDEYFSQPARREVLSQIDHVLHQIQGALAIQEQSDALAVVAHTRATLQQFADAEDGMQAVQQDFERIAQNIGALSFYIEAMQHQSGDAHNMHLSFDQLRGVFCVNLLERRTPAPASFNEAMVQSVEEELLQRQQHSAELALSLTAEPQNAALQAQLKESLVQMRVDAALSDDQAATERAQTAINILNDPNFSGSQQSLNEIVSAIVPLHATESTPEKLLPALAQVSDEEADAELLEIFLSEADEVLSCIRATVPQARVAPHNQEHLIVLRRAFHTLKGSSRMIALTAFGEASWSVEQVLNLWLSEARSGTPDLYALLDHAVVFLDDWVKEIHAEGISTRTAQMLTEYAQQVRDGETFLLVESAAAATDTVECADEAADLLPVPAQAEEVALSDADMALFANHNVITAFPDVPDVAALTDHVDAVVAALHPDACDAGAEVISFPGMQETRQDDSIKKIGDLSISLPLYNIYLAETDQLVRLLSLDFSEWRHEPERPVAVQSIHAAHSLAGSSATVGFKPLQEVAHALEMVLQRMALQPTPVRQQEFDLIESALERARWMLQQFAQNEMPYYEPALVSALDGLRHGLEARADDIEEFDPALALRDELDVDLLPVFLEEGRDILPQIESALRSWQKNAANSDGPVPVAIAQAILRHLHTIKGSARMAGAMVLGQHMHEMESHIETILHNVTPATRSPHVIDELLAHYDHGVQMFESLQRPQQAPAALPDTSLPAPVSLAMLMPATALRANAAAPLLAAAPTTVAVAQVRVNAEILDRLVNQAGEVSITRSRLESGVGSLQQSLLELTENVARLQSQLREIEMQAETQITSRMTLAGEREFDPLEFDRFTRLQELTRMMAESVNDVSSLQKNLTRTVDDASADLVTQGRLTRDLQQDLMHVRMVPFASVAERLYRLTRKVSKELGKRVNLDIRGSTVEIDRSVLEKMVGPFEHLLRNAIVHGIESREVRRAAGKSDIGELRIEIRQNGNEVLIQLSDDGQGVNLQQIRAKAKAVGLLASDQQLSDVETTDLIFSPGFSTVAEVTELAGRGVGMDVVRSEAAALGGRVAVASETGKGTRFTIHLPLTLAVTQVVILSAGGNTYAVPSALVEQVLQLKANLLASAYNDGMVLWQEQRVPLHYLSALLGEHHVTPLSQQYSPIMLLRSGNDRVAIHVDEIIGNREVVVKNIGPQLSRMIGIVGATVLGSGAIVLILNPVPLAQRYAQELRAPRTNAATELKAGATPNAVQAVGAVAETGKPDNTAGTVQGLRTQKIVMVVDDSLTVRRVTQRLLAREGYQVVLAKDGVDALQQMQAITPDIMLVDIEMPRMDGFDLTRNIRNDERTRHIPVIMITSRTAAKHRTYAMELGVNAYLGKPYQEEALLSAIRVFMQKDVAMV